MTIPWTVTTHSPGRLLSCYIYIYMQKYKAGKYRWTPPTPGLNFIRINVEYIITIFHWKLDYPMKLDWIISHIIFLSDIL